MAKVLSVESQTPAKQAKARKTLASISIEPKMGGGHIIRHHYQGYEHQPKDYHISAEGKTQGGKSWVEHLQQHAGLPEVESGAEEEAEGGSESGEY